MSCCMQILIMGGDSCFLYIMLGGGFTVDGFYLVVYGQAHDKWLKQLQAKGFNSMPNLGRFGVVKEATNLC
jgi:hypothetical protein